MISSETFKREFHEFRSGCDRRDEDGLYSIWWKAFKNKKLDIFLEVKNYYLKAAKWPKVGEALNLYRKIEFNRKKKPVQTFANHPEITKAMSPEEVQREFMALSEFYQAYPFPEIKADATEAEIEQLEREYAVLMRKKGINFDAPIYPDVLKLSLKSDPVTAKVMAGEFASPKPYEWLRNGDKPNNSIAQSLYEQRYAKV